MDQSDTMRLKPPNLQALAEDEKSKEGKWGSKDLHTISRTRPQADEEGKEKKQAALIAHQLKMPSDCYVSQVCMTKQNTIVLTTTGILLTWGAVTPCLGRILADVTQARQPMEIELDEPIVQIAAGRNHVLALDVKGKVYAWGKNQFGQLGKDPKIIKEYITPTEIGESINKNKIIQIFAGDNCGMAIDSNNKLIVWGSNNNRRLCEIDEDIISEPREIKISAEDQGESKQKKEMEFSKDARVVLGTPETYFFSIHKMDANPQVLLLEKQLADSRREVAKLKRKISEDKAAHDREEQRAASGMREGKELITLSYVQIDKIDESLRKLDKRKKEVEQQKRDLESENEQLKRDIDSLKERYNKDTKAISESLDKKQQEKSTKDSELKNVTGAFESLKIRIDLKNQWKKDYETFISLMKKQVLQNYLTTKLTDMEELLSCLYDHFKEVQVCSVLSVRHRIDPSLGIKHMIEKSNAELARLAKVPGGRKYDKSDPRYEIFNKMWEMISDNIAVRKELNYNISALMDQTNRKLEEEMRKDLTMKSDKLIKKDVLINWTNEALEQLRANPEPINNQKEEIKQREETRKRNKERKKKGVFDKEAGVRISEPPSSEKRSTIGGDQKGDMRTGQVANFNEKL